MLHSKIYCFEEIIQSLHDNDNCDFVMLQKWKQHFINNPVTGTPHPTTKTEEKEKKH